MERLIEAINTKDRVEDVLKGFLIVLSTGNNNAFFARKALSSGVVQCLTNLLKQTWVYLEEQNLVEGSPGSEYKNINIIRLALSCIYYICDSVSPYLYQKYVDKDFVSTLLSYIIPDPALSSKPDPANHFFQFGPSYRESIRDAISSFGNDGCVLLSIDEDQHQATQSPQKATGSQASGVPEHVEEKELRFYNHDYYQALGKSVQIKPCQVQFSTEAGEKSLASHLISQGVAWPKGDKMLSHSEAARMGKPKQTQDGKNSFKYEAAKITHVLRGNFFWAVVGEKKLNQMQQLGKGLLDFKSQLVNVKPKKLDVIAARIKTDSKEILVRGRVIEEGDKRLKVFKVLDLDSGCLHQVPACHVYNLPSLYNLIKLPPLASLLCLQGVCPSPLDPQVPELALGSLALIVRNDSISSVSILFEFNILNALPGLITCPDLEVAYRALELVVNMISYRIQKVRQTQWYTLIPGAIATLKRCMEKTFENRKLLDAKRLAKLNQASSPSSDPSDVSFSPSSSDSSGYSSSNSTSLPTMAISEKNSRLKAVVESCIGCLANSMFLCCKGKSVFYQHHGLDIVIQAFSLYYNQETIRLMCIKTLANYVNFNKTSNPVLTRYRFRGFKPHQPQPNVAEKSSQDDLFPDLEGHSTPDSEDSEDEEDLSSDVSPQISGVDLHQSSSFTSEDGEDIPARYYVKGDKAQFIQDATHELQLSSSPEKNDFAAVICGFLNTGRTGTIYLGIDPKDSTVLGLELGHGARDELRMGVDHLMAEALKPGVLHLQFHVEFVPVVNIPARTDANNIGASATDEKMFHLGHDYVVEIEVKPMPNVIYCCNTNECFYRLDGKTLVLDCQLIRQILILEEEAEHVEQIVQLTQELDALKLEAAELQILPLEL